MTPIIENGILTTQLDCQGFNLLNVGALEPVPPSMLDTSDPVLSDPREILPGSITDSSVADTAAIDQSKINWTAIPAAWLGNGAEQAAQGNLAEYVANKDIASGYAGLGSDGLLSPHQVPTGPGAGTINSVFLSLVPRHFDVLGTNPITTTGTWIVQWKNAPNNSIFGVDGPIGPGRPVSTRFITTLDISLIPNLDASQFAGSIQFALPLLPLAEYGADHAQGILPDPGVHTHPLSYFSRSCSWRDFPQGIPYAPAATSPQITVKFEPNDDGSYQVVVFSPLQGSVLFTRVNDAPFAEAIQDKDATNITQELTVQYGDHVEAYAAKQGYNDSPISLYDVTPPPGDQ